MSRAHAVAIAHHCPNVTLVIDHFRVTKALTEAADEVRKEQWRPSKLRPSHPPGSGPEGRVRVFPGLCLQGRRAEKFLRRMTAALKSPVLSLRTFVGAPREHLDNILALVDKSPSNAIAHGFNCVIRIVKNRASGYRRLQSFTDMTYPIAGDVDIPGHIPSNLRTL